MEGLEEAIEALRKGTPVLIYDSGDRESEVDMVFHASKIDKDRIYTLRTVAGGLICYATDWKIASQLGLTWGDTLISMYDSLRPLTEKRLGYGDRPAFTIWVNHHSVKTGISDIDRAKTIRALNDVIEIYYERGQLDARAMFLSEFQAPGHVPLLAARSLRERKGHTELSVSLSLIAGMKPSVVFAEMLDYGVSLSIDKARRIAEENGWPIVEGRVIVEACRHEEVCWSR